MSNFKIVSKKIAAGLLYYGGVVNILRDINRSRNIILAYHRILPEWSDELGYIESGMYVTTKTFAMHMAYLSQHYQMVSLVDAIVPQANRNACAITFDDGWADNYQYAYPILQHYKIPATIFLATGTIGTTEWPWPDRIYYYVHKASDERLHWIIGLLDDFFQKRSNLKNVLKTTPHDRIRFSECVVNILKCFDNFKVRSLMAIIDNYMGEYREMLLRTRPWLTWEEVRKMACNNIDFGAHTHNHVILTNTDIKRVIEEVRTSKEIISKKLERPVELFCYPNGNYNAAIVEVVRDQGYKMAVTTQPGTVPDSESPLTLKRIMIHDDMTAILPMFACKILNRIPMLS